MQGSVELSQQLPAKHKQAPVPRAHREAQISLEAAGDVPPPALPDCSELPAAVLISGSRKIGARAAFFVRITSQGLARGHSRPPRLQLEPHKGARKVNKIPAQPASAKAATAIEFPASVGPLPSPARACPSVTCQIREGRGLSSLPPGPEDKAVPGQGSVQRGD